MKISNIKKYKSETDIKISADFELRSGKKKEIFFKVPLKYEEFVVGDSGTFFPLGLILSMKLGEDLFLESSLPEQGLKNWEKISSLLVKWKVGFSSIYLNCSYSVKEEYNPESIGTFFSGGVDSFYTLLKNKNNIDGRISHLLLVHGFDVDLNDDKRFEGILKNIEEVKKTENIELIVIKTNLRDFTEDILGWGLCHGAALASVSLLLRKGLAKVYIPSSFTFDTLRPWGTHPDLDPLWGTETLTILHDGCDITRSEKTKFISESETALNYLRVCWKNVADKYNCCSCPKCLRTMIDLEISGKLERCKTFDTKIDLNVLRNVNAQGHSERVFFKQSLNTLERNGTHHDLQEVLRYLLYEKKYKEYNVISQKMKDFVRRIDKKYNKSRLYHYAAKRGTL